MRINRNQGDRRIAKALGVTPVGLKTLAWALAHDGEVKGNGMPNPGSARTKLIQQGYCAPWDKGVGYQITDAGREIVRRARQMGW